VSHNLDDSVEQPFVFSDPLNMPKERARNESFRRLSKKLQ